MKSSLLAFLLAVVWPAGGPSHDPCPPTSGPVEPRIKVHGRAIWGSSVSLWVIGTDRSIALMYDERRFPTFSRYIEEPGVWVFADFEIYPFQPERPGIRRGACLSTISNLVIQRWDEDDRERSQVFRVKRCPECTAPAK